MWMWACSPRLPLMKPTLDDQVRADSLVLNQNNLDLQKAHKLYINKCSGCHFLYRPYEYSLKKWNEMLPEMKTEAKLTDEQYLMIENYIQIMQARKPVVN